MANSPARMQSQTDAPCVLTPAGLEALIKLLRRRGYRLIGPRVRDGAIVYDEMEDVNELPVGWTDVQEPGRYRLERRDDDAVFGYAVGPHAWKQFLHPPLQTQWRARRQGANVTVQSEAPQTERFAFLGVRACELAAISVQDRVFMDGPYLDRQYAARRRSALFIAVNCGVASTSCFCTSMNTGPRVSAGYDLALTELIDAQGRRYLAEAGSPAGSEILSALPTASAAPADVAAGKAVSERTAASIRRRMPEGAREALADNLDHPRWDDVAERCLSCGNCTMVCPTCFCTTMETTTDLAGAETIQNRRWDSCFTTDFSYIHGGPVRASPRSRYRQWLTHKLSTWHDQFGESGCVGCGRCITWCPVGIDITEEVRAIGAPPEQGAAS